jgi:hypothetical protein
MTQDSTFDDNGDHQLSSTAAIDTLMRATRVMAVRGFVLSVYAFSLATKDHHSILSRVVSESASPQRQGASKKFPPMVRQVTRDEQTRRISRHALDATTQRVALLKPSEAGGAT